MKISVIIPAYNAERTVARAIESVLAQTRPADEVIVIDDGSDDATAEVVRSYGNKVILIQQDNAGVSVARNTGIERATGDWIAFLDADDEWLPERLMLQVRLLQINPHLVWTTGNYFTCSCCEKRRAPRVVPSLIEKLMKQKGVFDDFFIGCGTGLAEHTDTMLIRKDALIEVGLFDTAFSKAEDLDLWWKIAHQHPTIGYISKPVAIHHFGNDISLNKAPFKAATIVMLVSRHQALAKGTATEQSFNAMVAGRLQGWMQSMLFHALKEDIRELLREFKTIIPVWYRFLMYGLTVFPRLTRAGCLLISKIVRILRLRRRVVVPPNAAKSTKEVF